MLNQKEMIVVSAYADALFPPGGPIPISGCEAGLVPYLNAYLAALPKMRRFLARLLLVFIQLSPWIFGPRRARFTRLSTAERILVLESMRVSTFYFRRIAGLSMRTMLTMGYLAAPVVSEHMRLPRKSEVSP